MPLVAKQSSKQEIKNVLRQVSSELKHKYGVSRIGLFGSVVRKDEQIVHDVDLLVEFERPN
jgi:predicted nucleotidyltransferase